jgi:hypothetical protein
MDHAATTLPLHANTYPNLSWLPKHPRTLIEVLHRCSDKHGPLPLTQSLLHTSDNMSRDYLTPSNTNVKNVSDTSSTPLPRINCIKSKLAPTPP